MEEKEYKTAIEAILFTMGNSVELEKNCRSPVAGYGENKGIYGELNGGIQIHGAGDTDCGT